MVLALSLQTDIKSIGAYAGFAAIVGLALLVILYFAQAREIRRLSDWIDDEDERGAKTEELRSEYAEDIDILHLASEMVIDAVIEPEDLRSELVLRFAHAASKRRDWPAKRNAVTPV